MKVTANQGKQKKPGKPERPQSAAPEGGSARGQRASATTTGKYMTERRPDLKCPLRMQKNPGQTQ